MAVGTATAIALGIGGLSGIGNAVANMSAQDRAKAAQDANVQQWLQLNVPDPAQQKLVLDKFVQQGVLDPKLQTAIAQKPSEFQKIVTSGQEKGAQLRALNELQDEGSDGGLRLQDKATIQDATLKGQVADRANRNAIEAGMAQRGLGGSGFDVAAQLSGQSTGADRNATSSLNTAASAQQRALEAIEKGGELGGQLRTQDFNEASAKASAQDAINRFNTTNAQGVNAANTGIANSAAATNLASAQDVANKNTQASNDAAKYNSQLTQQQYENQVQKLQGQTGTLPAQTALTTAQGQSLGNTFSNFGTGIEQGATADANHQFLMDYLDAQKKKAATATPNSAAGSGY